MGLGSGLQSHAPRQVIPSNSVCLFERMVHGVSGALSSILPKVSPATVARSERRWHLLVLPVNTTVRCPAYLSFFLSAACLYLGDVFLTLSYAVPFLSG